MIPLHSGIPPSGGTVAAAELRTLVVSDAHLSDDASSRAIGAALASLIGFAGHAHGSRLEIVLNGDLFDLDAAFDGADPTALLRRVLHVQEAFSAAVRAALARGCPVALVAGNHDPDVALAAPRALLEATFPGLQVRSWLHLCRDGAIAEHGHLYDPSCVTSSVAGRADTVGSVLARRTSAVFPGLDPHGADPLATPPVVALRRAREAARDPRCARDMCLSAAALLRGLGAVRPGRLDAGLLAALAARETGLPEEALRRHAELIAPRASADGLAGSAHEGAVLASVRSAQLAAARIHRAPAVVVGHTHRPAVLDTGRAYLVDAGSWHVGPDGRASGTYAWLRGSEAPVRGVHGASVLRRSPWPTDPLPSREAVP